MSLPNDAELNAISPYPPIRYTGEGEVSAVHRSGAETPELTYPNGNQVSYLAKGSLTEGKFGLYRWDFGESPSGPAPHIHRTISESFFILSGTVRLFNGEKWIDATAGDFLYVPEGGIHAFRNESGEEASMLLMFSPGAPREEYFEMLVERAAQNRPPMSEQERMEFLLKHDNIFV
ncbi:cupin domain-containing protein [Streptacidiphilus sp. MAP5-3]|uniref:cupin domain-containing protein n=1 Tax=unclassified Streptacidiphilus TaxID=2643834 RepID=UPI003514CFC2